MKLTDSARYAGLGNSRTFTVERAFMRNTFHVSFFSPTNQKRKYCFSVPNDEAKSKLGQVLRKQIAICKSKSTNPTENELRHIAEKVSLQVLRDAVIPPDDPSPQTRARQGSVSTTYEHTAGRDEKALGPLVPPTKAGSERTSGLVEIRTGKELVLLCRQNSLLPGLLELLSSGREDVRTQSKQVPIIPNQHRTNGSSFGLSREQSLTYGHGRKAGGSMSDAKRAIMTGRF
jgi:hypothetical protein